MMQAKVLSEIIRGRRSVRTFKNEPVDRDLVLKLIEAAAWAPSAGNRQGWFFSIITSEAVLKEMADAVRDRWRDIVESNRDLGFADEIETYAAWFSRFTEAPVVIAVSWPKTSDLERRMLGDAAVLTGGGIASAAMAAQNLMLAAQASGLGTCCLSGALAAADELKRSIGLERKREIVCLIALGKPDEAPSPPARKPLAEIVRFVE